VFILAPSLIGRDDLTSPSGENSTTTLFSLLTLAGEYSGEMDRSLSRTYSLVSLLQLTFIHRDLATVLDETNCESKL